MLADSKSRVTKCKEYWMIHHNYLDGDDLHMASKFMKNSFVICLLFKIIASWWTKCKRPSPDAVTNYSPWVRTCGQWWFWSVSWTMCSRHTWCWTIIPGSFSQPLKLLTSASRPIMFCMLRTVPCWNSCLVSAAESCIGLWHINKFGHQIY